MGTYRRDTGAAGGPAVSPTQAALAARRRRERWPTYEPRAQRRVDLRDPGDQGMHGGGDDGRYKMHPDKKQLHD